MIEETIDYRELLQAILQKNSILFLGAGFSMNATNLKGSKVKSGALLKDYLIESIGGNDFDTDLNTASREYIEAKGEYSLIELLKNEFTINSTTPSQDFILSLPWKRIYTTNYDDVVDVASRKSSNYFESVSLDVDPIKIKDKTQKCICLNGSIHDLTSDSLYNTFKLTTVSYLAEDFVNSKWVSLFRDDLETSDVIVFLGFSMRNDLDIQRVVYGSTSYYRTKFIVRPDESERSKKEISTYGEVLAVGVDSFSSELEKEFETFIPLVSQEYHYWSFEKVVLAKEEPVLKDTDVSRLLIDGVFKKDIIQYSISNPDNFEYYIYRDKIDKIISEIENKEKNFLIHSDLGNGKTMFIQGLSIRLKSEGYNVFVFQRYYDNIEKELEEICKAIKPVIIIENYSSHFDILQRIKQIYGNNEVVLIVSERSLMNDTIYYDLENKVFGKRYSTYDLNKLTVTEKNALASLIDNYGLWGEYANASLVFKANLISAECKSNLRLVLLKVLDSNNIKNKFNDILSGLKDKREQLNIVLLLFISNMLNFDLKISDLIYLLGQEGIQNGGFRNNHSIKEIINFTDSEIQVRSSILSEALIHDFKETEIIVSLLIQVTKRLDKAITSKKYSQAKYILGRVISHTRLQTLFSTKDNIDDLITIYFENIKNLDYCRSNPHFWLQYAITRLALKDFRSAKIYFDNAYSYGKMIFRYDATSIDNHFARYLIENELSENNMETAMMNFLRAHAILNDSNNNTLKHYPYRVAINYRPFYEKFFKRLDEKSKTDFLKCCKDILERIDLYKIETGGGYKLHTDIVKCEQNLEYIIKKES